MTRRAALLLLALLPGGQLSVGDWKPGPLRIFLGGKNGISHVEVIGPDGDKLTFTPEEIMAALKENL